MSRLNRHRTAQSSTFALLVSTFLLSVARADEPGFKPTFNGKDRTGWRQVEIPDQGPLGLQSEINLVEYRNTRIKREKQGVFGMCP
jgi:hypothetical protein